MDHWVLKSQLLDFVLWYGIRKMTPNEITKLTEQARRAKTLMQRSADSGEHAKIVMNNYEKTLTNFEENIDRVSKEGAALAAMMSAMGNGGPVLEQAFSNDGDSAARSAAPVSANPSETAHLHKVD